MKSEDKRKRFWIAGTKGLLDFMFFAGIAVTVTLPVTLKFIGQYIERVGEHYSVVVVLYFVMGIAAVMLLRELRRIFRTVLDKNCFVQENVMSLRRMGKWSFFIVLMSVIRCFVFLTVAVVVVILVFAIAGLFSMVLSFVFEEAVAYKEENDFTI